MSDEAAFLQAICANPEDDTARLVFADWLDEHGNADRAEFIRVQIRMNAISPTGTSIPKELLQEWYELESRANELQRPEWSKCPCPACERYDPYKLAASYGRARASEILKSCPVCQGTRDILTASLPTYVGGSDPRHESRNPTFARGFIDSVWCDLDALGKYVAWKFTPSPWAQAVVSNLPVTRFRLQGFEPFSGYHSWGWSFGENSPNALPWFLFEALAPEPFWQTWKGYSTREIAIDALAVAACTVVRRAVYGDQT